MFHSIPDFIKKFHNSVNGLKAGIKMALYVYHSPCAVKLSDRVIDPIKAISNSDF